MPLVTCRECDETVSDQAQACPHCGAPVPWKQEFKGWGFEWQSPIEIAGWPLVHVAFGRGPDRRLRVAKGVIAVGQFGIGLFTIAQFGVGLLFGFGQFMLGAVAVGQAAVALVFAAGQLAVAWAAAGQVTVAVYGLCQVGLAAYLWDMKAADPEAVRFFCEWAATLELPFDLGRCADALPVERPPG